MQVASLVFGILSIAGMIIAFFPCFGSLNWINIPFAVIGLVISIIALVGVKEGEPKGNSIVGLILCSTAIIFGIIRLTMGGGVL